MGEREMLRQRAREPKPGIQYEALYDAREEYTKRQTESPLVIKGKSKEWELCRQGHIRWYLNPYVDNQVALQDWLVFIHDIKTHSGKHRHQGGLVLFVLEGKGATTCDDITVEWEKGDIILLPLKGDGGVTHQHFNREPGKPAKWLAFINVPFWNESGSELVQRSVDPEWERLYGSGIPQL